MKPIIWSPATTIDFYTLNLKAMIIENESELQEL